MWDPVAGYAVVGPLCHKLFQLLAHSAPADRDTVAGYEAGDGSATNVLFLIPILSEASKHNLVRIT